MLIFLMSWTYFSRSQLETILNSLFMDDHFSTIKNTSLKFYSQMHLNMNLDGLIHQWPWHTFQGHRQPSMILEFHLGMITLQLFKILISKFTCSYTPNKILDYTIYQWLWILHSQLVFSSFFRYNALFYYSTSSILS